MAFSAACTVEQRPKSVRGIKGALEDRLAWSLPPTNVSSLPPWRRNTSRSPKVSVTSAHGALARVVAQQHPEQLADIQGIRLRSPEPSIHFDARRVHDHVRDPEGSHVPVQPEPVAARLVAAPH